MSMFTRRFHSQRLRNAHLLPVSYEMIAANKSEIRIDGAIVVRLEGLDSSGRPIQCAVMVYISPDANGFYLSREAMTQLGIIAHDFPRVGAALHGGISGPPPTTFNTTDTPCTENDCHCPERQAPPGKPTVLPFPCTPENNDRMKRWLLDRYASSTFNTCTRQTPRDGRSSHINTCRPGSNTSRCQNTS